MGPVLYKQLAEPCPTPFLRKDFENRETVFEGIPTGNTAL